MSEEPLQAIVEEIGLLSDKAESDRWVLADAIATALAEFPSYSEGLVAGLGKRMKRSPDTIYDLQHASELRERLRYNPETITTSHFAALARLKKKYNLDDDKCREWLNWTKETGAHVREMREEIEIANTEDLKRSYFRRVDRLSKLLNRLWTDAESVAMPDDLRVLTKAMLKNLKDFLDNLMEWKSTSA